MRYELRQYSFGETIGKGFNLYFNNFVALVVVSILCQVPLFVLDQVTGLSKMAANPAMIMDNMLGYWSAIGVVLTASILLGLVVTAYVIHTVSRKIIDGDNGGLNNPLPSIATKIIPLFLLSLLTEVYALLWGLLLIIPGLIASLRYSMSTAVMMIENTGVKKAIERSKSLTQQRKGRIFGWIFINSLIIGCLNQPVVYVVSLLMRDPLLINALSYVLAGITTPLYGCILVVIYFNLRIEKEGFNIEHLTQQFALADTRENTLEA